MKAKKTRVKFTPFFYSLLIGVILLGVFILKQVSLMRIEQTLKAVVFDKVDAKTKGIWDRKVDIDQFDVSHKAVKGSWWAHDKWNWIGWKNTDDRWTVLISMDGFSCTELDGVPGQYLDFFQDVIYQFGKRYCY